MTPARQAWIASLCIVLFGLVMAGLRYMMTGFGEDFGWGFGTGLIIGIGMTFLASRQARETP